MTLPLLSPLVRGSVVPAHSSNQGDSHASGSKGDGTSALTHHAHGLGHSKSMLMSPGVLLSSHAPRSMNARSSLAPLTSGAGPHSPPSQLLAVAPPFFHQSSSSSLLSAVSNSTADGSVAKHHVKRSSQSHHPLVLAYEVLEQGSTQKRMRGEPVEVFLKRVTHISIVGKGVEAMESLELCKNLTVLYLYDNRISRISGLDACKGLTRLYLQNNVIETIEGLDCGLEKLTDLHLSGNKISYVSGLHALPSLEILHIDNQRTSAPLEFDVITTEALGLSLKHLTATSNRISDLTALTALAELQEIDLSHNDIRAWEEIKNLLVCCTELRTVNVNNNPIMHNVLKVRQRAILACKALECFNEKPIPQVERDFLYNMEIARRRSSNATSPGYNFQQHNQHLPANHQQQQQQHQHQQPPAAFTREQSATALLSAQAHPIDRVIGGGQNSTSFGMVKAPLGYFDDNRPIPHLPPFATQYRDLMLHQMASVSKAIDTRRVALRSGFRRAARAAETSGL